MPSITMKSGVVGPPRYVDHLWPADLCPADPWAGDEVAPDSSPWSDHTVHGGVLDEDAHREADDDFLLAYRAILDGRAPWDATDAASALLGIDGPRRHDRRPPRVSAPPPNIHLDAEIAEDRVPEIGLMAPDRVFGPWSDEGLGRAARCLAIAILAYSPIQEPRVRPIGRTVDEKRYLDRASKAGLRAIHASPPMLWTGDLRPALPLAPAMHPTGSAPHSALVARAVLGPDGWWLAHALPLPRLPDPARIERRLDLEYRRLRRHDRRLTWEDLLRDRGELLYRTVSEWCWLHAPEETWTCWQRAGLC